MFSPLCKRVLKVQQKKENRARKSAPASVPDATKKTSPVPVPDASPVPVPDAKHEYFFITRQISRSSQTAPKRGVNRVIEFCFVGETSSASTEKSSTFRTVLQRKGPKATVSTQTKNAVRITRIIEGEIYTVAHPKALEPRPSNPVQGKYDFTDDITEELLQFKSSPGAENYLSGLEVRISPTEEKPKIVPTEEF